MLEIKNLTKRYGDKVAVDNLSLTINDGEVYGFIGHNGAGKTTTIKCLTGILDYCDGEIYIDGMDIKKEPIKCKQITAYIPDNPDIYDYLTGIQYLNFVSDVYKIPTEKRKYEIEKYAKIFDVYDNLSDLISSYSHGMKQKLVLISALIHSPKLLVLDEPFVGLDPVASHKVKEIMKEMCQKGTSVFFSTHVLEVAEKLCDKIAIIKQGKLVASGTTKDVIGSTSLENVFLELSDEK